MEIENAREEDSGMYWCEARNINDTVVFDRLFEVSVVPRMFGVDQNIFSSNSLENKERNLPRYNNL